MTSSSNSFCAKCGRPVPTEAEFCPGCGTQISPIVVDSTPPTVAPTRLVEEAVTFVSGANAATIGPTGVVTSLGSTAGRVGDGGFRAGDQVGPRYTIIKLLGTGGMGAVYQAFDHELGVAVAIKVIRPAAQSDATAARDLELRFKRELVLARQITHKYVVRIHDIGDADGIKYLTMPFIEGETLADPVQNRMLSSSRNWKKRPDCGKFHPLFESRALRRSRAVGRRVLANTAADSKKFGDSKSRVSSP